MKKVFLIFVAFIFISFYSSYNTITEEKKFLSKKLSTKNIDTTFDESNDNMENININDKKLFLQFLNNKIPVKDYEYSGVVMYYSDIINKYGYGNENPKDSNSIFFITDMTGDGKKDFAYFYNASIDIITYDEEEKIFKLWFTGKSQLRPIGNKEMYSIITSQPIVYEHFTYDEKTNLLSHKTYTSGEIYDEIEKATTIIYKIDDKVVSEEKWKEETKYFFELKSNAPMSLSYEDLISD